MVVWGHTPFGIVLEATPGTRTTNKGQRELGKGHEEWYDSSSSLDGKNLVTIRVYTDQAEAVHVLDVCESSGNRLGHRASEQLTHARNVDGLDMRGSVDGDVLASAKDATYIAIFHKVENGCQRGSWKLGLDGGIGRARTGKATGIT